ncbi:hypothetical protein Tco_1233793 [Tanacetum coccineum]
MKQRRLPPCPHDSPFPRSRTLGSDEGRLKHDELMELITKLSGKARRRARIVLSEDKDAADDPSKQGRKIAQIDTYPTIYLVQDEGTSWF